MMNVRLVWSMTRSEVLVVVAIIAVLVALLLPAVQQARESARQAQSKNNLKQIGLGLHNYENAYGMFPPGGVFDEDGKPFHGWTTAIMPFLDASPWYSWVNFNIPWDHPDQIETFQRGYGSIYLNPSISERCGTDGLMQTHYAGSDVIFYRNSFTRISELTNGLAQTLCIGDSLENFEPLGYAYNWRSAALGLKSDTNGFGCSVRPVTQMLMTSGEVRVFSDQTDQELFASLQGVNSKWEDSPGDVSKPPEPYKLSPPIVCLWVDRGSASALMGVQNESKQLVRAWFWNSRTMWHDKPVPTWDRTMLLLKSHKSLRELNLRDAITDQGIRVLKELPNLEKVCLAGRSVTDKGVQLLSQFPKLKHLELTSTALGLAGLKALADAPNLESIRIEYWRDEIGFSPQSVVEFVDQMPFCDVTIVLGRVIDVDHIRELAKKKEPWPEYKGGK